jgi:hypothetical protein
MKESKAKGRNAIPYFFPHKQMQINKKNFGRVRTEAEEVRKV